MFDGCHAWRRLLTRQAEGVISPTERALLQNHLLECAHCREAEKADGALRSMRFTPEPCLSPSAARSLEDKVIHGLRAYGDTSPQSFFQRLYRWWTEVSLEYCGQLVGGALVAASITGFFVVSALHPVNMRTAAETASIAAREHNEPPVPLEALFQSASPRAAMLWATPSHSQDGMPEARRGGAPSQPPNATTRKTKSDTPRRHGSRLRDFTLS
jgi:hypothetical protein